MTSIYFISSPIGTVASFYLLFWVVGAGVPYPLEPKLAQAEMDVARAWNIMKYIIIYMKWYLEICCFATDIVSDYMIVPYQSCREFWTERREMVPKPMKTRYEAVVDLMAAPLTQDCLTEKSPGRILSQRTLRNKKWFAGVLGLTGAGNVIPQVPLGMKPRNFWLCFFCWEWFFASQNMVHHQFNVFGLRPWCQETCKPKQLWRWSYAQISQIKGRIKILSTTEHNEEESWRHDIFIVFQSFSVQFFFKLLMLCEVSALLAGDAFLSEAKNQQLPTHSPFWSQG